MQLLDSYYERSKAPILPRPVAHSICHSVDRLLNPPFVTTPLSHVTHDLAQTICTRSHQMLIISEDMNIGDYCSQFTDYNLRWEAIGNIFAIAGMCLMSLDDKDPLLSDSNTGKKWSKATLASQLIHACDTCAIICIRYSLAASEVTVAFLCNSLQFLSMVFGDGSSRLWSRLAEISGLVYSTELHLDQNKYPRFLRQWRRIIFASAFFLDKAVATFSGKPPLINWRFCDMTPPQDLNTEDMLSTESHIAQPRCNEHGWNLHGRLNDCSFVRLRFMISALRAEILEVCLEVKNFNVEDRARFVLSLDISVHHFDIMFQRVATQSTRVS